MTEPPREYVEAHAPTRWWLPWMPASQVRRQLQGLWSYAVAQTESTTVALEQMGVKMADVSNELRAVAEGLRELGPKIAAVLQENHDLRGEDAAESAAAHEVREAFESVRQHFAPVEEVPTPEPLPEPSEPGDGDDDGPGSAA